MEHKEVQQFVFVCTECGKRKQESKSKQNKKENIVESFVFLTSTLNNAMTDAQDELKNIIKNPYYKPENSIISDRINGTSIIAENILSFLTPQSQFNPIRLQQQLNEQVQLTPCCKSCIDMLLLKLDEITNTVQYENNHLQTALMQQQQQTPVQEKEEEIESLLQEEEELLMELNYYKQELERLDLEKRTIIQKSTAQKEAELKYWKYYFINEDFLTTIIERNLSTQRKLDFYDKEFTILSNLNLKSFFHIWYENDAGTINHLRLARICKKESKSAVVNTGIMESTFALEDIQQQQQASIYAAQEFQRIIVEWDEVNAALGLIALLLHTFSKRKDFQFSMHKIHPMASQSKIEEKEVGKYYPLFYSQPKFANEFNKGLVACLRCVKEISEFANSKQQSKQQQQPFLFYFIKDDLINGVSIKYLVTQELDWTKACKYMLLNLKSAQRILNY